MESQRAFVGARLREVAESAPGSAGRVGNDAVRRLVVSGVAVGCPNVGAWQREVNRAAAGIEDRDDFGRRSRVTFCLEAAGPARAGLAASVGASLGVVARAGECLAAFGARQFVGSHEVNELREV